MSGAVRNMLPKAKLRGTSPWKSRDNLSPLGGILWHLWFINSFTNEYFKTEFTVFKKICADFKN